jgi:hypothetical protein
MIIIHKDGNVSQDGKLITKVGKVKKRGDKNERKIIKRV